MTSFAALASSAGAETLAARYRANRQRSRSLFDLLADEAYYSRPIDLRHPIVFYEGHLPAFSFNTLIKRALGRPGIDARLEQVFARGIDPSEAQGTGENTRGEDIVRIFNQSSKTSCDSRVIITGIQ